MEFSKVAEQNTYNQVVKNTQDFRNGESPFQIISGYLSENGVDITKTVFPAITEFDDNIFQGTLINQDRRVLEFFIDTTSPEDSDLDDVTEQLGPKDPSHPESDIKDVITMSLVYFDEENQNH